MAYKILLVDDDRDLLPSMVALLRELSDFQIVTADNGARGLEQVYQEQPDCIVIDVRMPELNGYQLAQALRGDAATAHIPLIILSALITERDQWVGLAVGVDRYLTKPVDGLELIATITDVMRRTAHDRQVQLEDLAEQARPES